MSPDDLVMCARHGSSNACDQKEVFKAFKPILLSIVYAPHTR